MEGEGSRSYVALKPCSLSMYAMICFSFHRLWTYSCSISEYTAAHSLGVGANCRAGTIDRADRLVRGAICGSFIVACIKGYHEEVVERKELDPLKLEAPDPCSKSHQ